MILGIVLFTVGILSLCFQLIRKLSKEYYLHKTKKEKYNQFINELNNLLKL